MPPRDGEDAARKAGFMVPTVHPSAVLRADDQTGPSRRSSRICGLPPTCCLGLDNAMSAARVLTIDRRFNGPPDSANGGYLSDDWPRCSAAVYPERSRSR
jgi:hypothetical protein